MRRAGDLSQEYATEAEKWQDSAGESTMGALTTHDLAAFAAGRHSTLYRKLGSHLDSNGVGFSVWAPRARAVRVVGEVAPRGKSLVRRGGGIWTGRVQGARAGQGYAYEITTARGRVESRADPFAVSFAEPSAPDAIICDLGRRWRDGAWMKQRSRRQAADRPISIYETHLGSWRRGPNGAFLNYRQAARELATYVSDLGFTHVELLPLAEHPFYGSWGYQATGYFAPTCRYGSPQDLMAAVETLHRAGIGVILDWVPSHFANDLHGLARFGGSALYEHPDRRKGFHPDWNSAVFNYESGQVRSFLLSSARWWLETFHIDGLRVDAVASMLYLDFSRDAGEWEPNEYGGNENLAAIEFLRSLNAMVREEFPGVIVAAEESSSWPGVTRPEYLGGLGFDFKWDMGWMNDTLAYLRRDPVHRTFHHHDLTFRMLYAFAERFVLALSHDEVVHVKGSLASKMPGTSEERLAQLRLLYGYMWAQPGKKLLFMGGELGQWSEWDHEGELDWGLLRRSGHKGIGSWVRDLNRLLRDEPALHQQDADSAGFAWVDADDSARSVLSFVRYDASREPLLVVVNFTPEPWHRHRLGVPLGGRWKTLLNSDDRRYGGGGSRPGRLFAEARPSHGFEFSLAIDVPPFAAVFARRVG
ncbi:MAG: 1,4-alpha-glucan branching protein GlgB [Acidobacteriota bacterium]|nr:1,4-alpha-glucan branching protein GlgB [Acidobacteriota bacterium]